jgi:hypothetical protein
LFSKRVVVVVVFVEYGLGKCAQKNSFHTRKKIPLLDDNKG